jgi:hypothetical protein
LPWKCPICNKINDDDFLICDCGNEIEPEEQKELVINFRMEKQENEEEYTYTLMPGQKMSRFIIKYWRFFFLYILISFFSCVVYIFVYVEHTSFEMRPIEMWPIFFIFFGIGTLIFSFITYLMLEGLEEFSPGWRIFSLIVHFIYLISGIILIAPMCSYIVLFHGRLFYYYKANTWLIRILMTIEGLILFIWSIYVYVFLFNNEILEKFQQISKNKDF